jgi:hypothetical protein
MGLLAPFWTRPLQVEGCRLQGGHRPSAITSLVVGVPMELGVADPEPALHAPSVRMCSAACLAPRIQVMSRPWLIT